MILFRELSNSMYTNRLNFRLNRTAIPKRYSPYGTQVSIYRIFKTQHKMSLCLLLSFSPLYRMVSETTNYSFMFIVEILQIASTKTSVKIIFRKQEKVKGLSHSPYITLHTVSKFLLTE